MGRWVVERLAQFTARPEPGLRGFTGQNLSRMRQFNEAYKEDSIVSPLVTELPWSHHLIILGQSKRSKNASPTCKMQSIQNLVLESVRRGKPRIIGFYARCENVPH